MFLLLSVYLGNSGHTFSFSFSSTLIFVLPPLFYSKVFATYRILGQLRPHFQFFFLIDADICLAAIFMFQKFANRNPRPSVPNFKTVFSQYFYLSLFKIGWVPASNSGGTRVTPATYKNLIDLRMVMNLHFDSE